MSLQVQIHIQCDDNCVNSLCCTSGTVYLLSMAIFNISSFLQNYIICTKVFSEEPQDSWGGKGPGDHLRQPAARCEVSQSRLPWATSCQVLKANRATWASVQPPPHGKVLTFAWNPLHLRSCSLSLLALKATEEGLVLSSLCTKPLCLNNNK